MIEAISDHRRYRRATAQGGTELDSSRLFEKESAASAVQLFNTGGFRFA